jgi:hypothetical protein
VKAVKNAAFCDVTPSVRTDVSKECQFLQEPHGVTSHKTAFFIPGKLAVKVTIKKRHYLFPR